MSARASDSRLSSDADIAPFSIFESMPADRPGAIGEIGASKVELGAERADLRADGGRDGEAGCGLGRERARL